MPQTNFLFQVKTAVASVLFAGLFPGVFLAVALPGLSGNAATLTVNATADDGSGTCKQNKCTLRDAILTATSGDAISFSLPANSVITLTNGQLLIDKNLSIIGPGANTLTIRRSDADGTPVFRLFTVNGSFLAISGVTISNGNGGEAGGGAISNSGGTVSVNNCTIIGNSNSPSASGSGGGIVNQGTMTITNSTISANGVGTAGSGGGVSNASGKLTITNSTVSGNHANSGGGLSCTSGSTITMTNCTIAENSAFGQGGGIYAQGTLNLKSTIVAKNTATQGPDISGGVSSTGYNLIGNKADTTITSTTGDQLNVDPKLDTLKNNGGQTSTYALLAGSTAINGGSSSGSTTDQRGFNRPVYNPSQSYVGDGSDIGAFEVQASDLPGCSEINLVVNNNNDSGGGSLRSVVLNACVGSTITFAPAVRGTINLASELLIDKSLTISGPGANLLTIQRTADSSTSFRVFDVSKANINVALSGITISGGNTGSPGGGVYSLGNLTLSRVAVSGNHAVNGGGVYNDFGTLTIDASTISANSVNGVISASGGGIFTRGGTVNINNSTISGNSANASNNNHDDSGGGMFSNLGTVTITNTTITGNSGDLGGGFRAPNGGTATVTNSIIDLNTSPNGSDVNGPMTSGGFNVIGNTTQALSPFQFSDQNGVTAAQLNLGPLQDNGGPTLTHALLSGSVAIDKGYSGGVTTDQRGLTRPADQPDVANYAFGGDGSDIGAFELQFTCSFSIAPTNATFPQSGGNDSIAVTSSTGCAWTAQSNDSFITVTAGATGSGSGTVSYSVAPNYGPTPRTGTLTIAGQAFMVNQQATTVLGNISTRLAVQTGDNVLIGGFIVTGTQDKKVLIRAIGPSTGVAGALADPTLDLYSGQSLLESNDNWVDSPNKQAIIDTSIPPSSNLESAIVRTLPANNSAYTAIVSGVDNGTGVGLVEVYDLDRSVDSKLANISTRGFVQTGDNVMIGGFIVLGQTMQNVLVRAIGPSLPVQGALPDPFLELHDGNGATIESNDNWVDSPNKQAIIDTTIPPSNNLESAIVRTLAPGNYTAIVSGVGGIVGVALVEVYALN